MEQIPVTDFLILALATFRVSRIFTTDVIFERLRDLIWKRFPPSTLFGYLFTCDWCFSIWAGLGFAFCYTIISTATVLIALPFALSAVAGLISKRLD